MNKNISTLNNQSRDIPKELINKNKYTYFSQFNIVPIKYLDINDSMTQDVQIKHFLAEHQQALLFPNVVSGRVTDIVVRSLDGKGHLKLGNEDFPYNVGNLSRDFRYGDTLYLVEGISDLIALKLLKPGINVIAMLTSVISKTHLETLKVITNNFVLFKDEDAAGEFGARRMLMDFKDHNLNLKVERSFSMYGFKDAGDLLDLLKRYRLLKDPADLTKIQAMQTYYSIKIMD